MSLATTKKKLEKDLAKAGKDIEKGFKKTKKEATKLKKDASKKVSEVTSDAKKETKKIKRKVLGRKRKIVLIFSISKSIMDLSKIEKFVDRQKVSFICSVDSEGFPNVRAMLKPRKRIGLKEFYFSTNTSSAKVQQYRRNSKASIYFYHKGLIKYTGVMLKGRMEVLTDQATKDSIWRAGDTIYYKEGKTDLDYCVLKFVAESGRYYSDLRTEDFRV